MSIGNIISLAGVVVALLGVILLSFRHLGNRIEKVDDKVDAIADNLHQRISGHAHTYVRKDDFNGHVDRIVDMVQGFLRRIERGQEEGFKRLEKALDAQALEHKQEALAARQRMGAMEQKIAVIETIQSQSRPPGDPK
jgi:hypothetical protein